MKASVLYLVSKLLIATQPYLILLHTSRKVGISWCINTKNFNFDLRLHLRPYQTHLFFFNVPPSRFSNISRWIICYYQLLLLDVPVSQTAQIYLNLQACVWIQRVHLWVPAVVVDGVAFSHPQCWTLPQVDRQRQK